MALPVVKTPTYELIFPSDKKVIKFRPFLVKEEKILLMIKEGISSKDIKDSILELLNNCIIGEKPNLSKRPLYDIEYFFLNLRAKSVGETVKLNLTQEHNIPCDDGCDECVCDQKTHEIEVNLEEIDVKFPKNFNQVIDIDDEIKVKIKHINMENVSQFEGLDVSADIDDKSLERVLKMIASSIELIIEGETVHETKDYTVAEVITFIQGLTNDQLIKIQQFLQDYPTLEKEIKFKCVKCKKKLSVTLGGLNNFF